eukprot:TRINITY_DN10901_c0_g2_i1.p1 TRINITY_DN10901_c0_g2~~TRINITY_DN10901_c0_g2_i1.p1  ORF type:complete len:324 (+),score=29.72 TRINITY_DN10901_c0_g2_i1:77-1048(+)
MFSLGDGRLMKTFLASVTTSTIVFGGLNFLGYYSTPLVKPLTAVANISGGFILGAGLYLSGSLPSTIFAQFGARFSTAFYAFIGGLSGTLVYGYLQPRLANTFLYTAGTSKSLTLPQALNLPYWKVAIPASAFFLLSMCAIEKIYPSKHKNPPSLNMRDRYWSPYLAGIMIGFLQIPSVILMKSGIGTSSAYVTIVSNIVCSLHSRARQNEYFQKYKTFPIFYWQLALDAGIVIGSWMSSTLSGTAVGNRRKTRSHVRSNLHIGMAMLGGFFLLFGARTANGCTTGHGISGLSQFAFSSFATVPSIFLGAVVCRKILTSILDS